MKKLFNRYEGQDNLHYVIEIIMYFIGLFAIPLYFIYIYIISSIEVRNNVVYSDFLSNMILELIQTRPITIALEVIVFFSIYSFFKTTINYFKKE